MISLEQREHGGRLPHEHVGVPQVLSTVHVHPPPPRIRLLGEPVHLEHLLAPCGAQRRPLADVPVSGLGTRRLNAHGEEIVGLPLGGLRRRFQDSAEGLRPTDVVVGPQTGHGASRISSLEQGALQSHRRAGVAQGWLDDEMVAWQLRQLLPHDLLSRRTGGHEHILRSGDGGDALHRVLDHRPGSGHGVKLLGPLRAAVGPQPRAHSSCSDDKLHDAVPFISFAHPMAEAARYSTFGAPTSTAVTLISLPAGISTVSPSRIRQLPSAASTSASPPLT